jgi:glycosyltransferase involved in cell wall biosynthesis
LNVVAARALSRRPTVIATFHQLSVPQGRRRRAAALAAHLTEAMVACGQEVRAALETWAPRGARLHTIGNGVALPPSTTESSRRAARARLGLPQEAVIVGFVGRLHEEKGPDRLLDAFLARFQGAPHVRLALVGAGPLDAKLRAGATNVHFVGEVVEAATLLPGFDLYAQPSLREGRSLSMLEAMAAGLPTVAHDLPAVFEIHEPGRTALLVAVGDSHGLEEALALLVADPQRRMEMGARARQRSQRFSVDTMVGAYASLYRAAAARGATR